MPVLWTGEIERDDEKFSCDIGNVSLAGTLIRCDTLLELGDEVLLRIGELGEFAGEVAWFKPPYYGLRLLAGPDMVLKKFAEASGEYPSRKPTKDLD